MPEYALKIKVDPGGSEPAVRGLAGALRDTATEAKKTDTTIKGMDGTFAGMGKKASDSAVAVSRSSAAASSAFQTFSKQVDTGGRGAERQLALLSLRTDELRTAIKAAQAAGSPVSQDAIDNLSRLERETDKEVKRLGQLREAQGDAARAVNAASATIDGQVRSMGSWRDLLDASNSKAGALALKVSSLWAAFEIGYSVGERLRAGLNWLTDGAFDRGVRSASQSLANWVVGFEEGAEASDVFRHNLALLKLHGIDPVGLSAEAAARRVEVLRRSLTALEFVRANADVLAGVTPDQSRDRQFNMATAYEYWQRVKNSTQEARLAAAQYGADLAAEMRKAGQPVSGHLARMEAIVKAHEAGKIAAADQAAAEKRAANEAATAWRQLQDRISRVFRQAEEEINAASRARAKLFSDWAAPVNVVPLELAAIKNKAAAQKAADDARARALADYAQQFARHNAEQEEMLKRLADQYRALGAGGGTLVTVYRQQRAEIESLVAAGEITYREGQAAINAATHDFFAGQLNAWTGFFTTVGSMFGGFAQQVATALQTVSQGYQTGSQLGAAVGTVGQGAQTGGVIGAFVGLAIAAYQYFSNETKRKRAESYGYAAVLSREEGGDWSTPLQGAGRRASMQIRETIEEFARVLGGVFTAFAALEIQVRRDGKYFRAFVEGVFLGSFTDMQSAVEAALLYAFSRPETALSGVSDLVRQAWQQAVKEGMTNLSLDELSDYFSKLREISEILWSDTARSTLEAVRHFDELRAALERLQEATPAVVHGFADLAAAEVDAWNAWRRQITGEAESPADQLASLQREAAVFNAQKAMRIADLKLREAELRIEAERLRGRSQLVRIGADIDRGEINLEKSYLEARAELAKIEASLYEQQIAAIEAALTAIGVLIAALESIPDIDIPNLRLPRVDGGRGAGSLGGGLGQMVRDSEYERGLSGMSDYARGLAEINKKWDDGIAAAGLHANAEAEAARAHRKAIKDANGNAAAIKAADEAYARSIANIARTRAEIEAANRAREEEIALYKKRAKESAFAGLADFEGIDAFTRLEGEANAYRALFEELYKTGAISADEYAAALGRVTKAEEERARVMGRQMYAGILSGIAQYLAEGEQKQKALAAAAQIEYSIKRATWATEIELLYLKHQLTVEEYNYVRGLLNSLPDLLPTAAGGFSGDGYRGDPNRDESYFENLRRQQEEHARNLADVNKALRDFKRSLALDELSPLTPVQRLQEAEQQYRATYAAAQAGDLEAARRFPQVFQDFFREMQRFGGIDARYLAFWNEGQAFLDQLIAQTAPANQPLSPANYPGPTAGQQSQQNAAVVTRLQNVQDATNQTLLVTRQIERIGDVQVTVLREIRDGLTTSSTTNSAAAGSRFGRVA